MKYKMKAVFLVFIAVFIANISLGYQVWFGLPYMPKSSLERLDEWDLVAAQLEGLNLNNVDTTRPADEKNEMVDWRNIVQQMPTAKDNGVIGFPRTHFNYGTVTSRGTLEEVLVTKFKLALPSRLNATIKWIMPFDNQPGEDRDAPTYEWSDAELQRMRDWLDNNGHADVQMLVNARSFSVRTQSFCKKTIMAGMSIEAKAYLWYENNGRRQNLLKWAVEEPLTKDKHFKFQMPFGKYDRPDGVTETPFQAMRGFMRWLSTSAMLDNTDFIRRDDVIFLVIIYDDNSNHLPETSTDGTQYQNTILSLTLSIIEQKDLFEGRNGLITKDQTMSYARTGAVDPGTEPTSGLVAHWPLDEGSGTVANDASGNEKTGTLLNGATWGSDATRDSYVSFDGTDDRISTTFTYALADTNDFTWAWWAKKPTATGTDNGAIMVGSRYGNTGSENYEFIKFTPVSVQFANSDTTGAIERYDYADISDTDWHHYAMVKDGASYQWYVDGAAQGVASNFVYSESSSIPFLIGGDGANKPNEHFEGCIDDVVLYREALTPEEVENVKNGIYPYGPLSYELIAGWDTWDSSTAPSPSVLAPNITGSAVTTTEQNAWNTTDERGASNDGDWGTFVSIPSASTNVVDGENLTLANATTGGTITFTVANNGTGDIELNAFHFDAYAFRPKAPRTYVLSVLAGSSISTGIVFSSAADAIPDVGGTNANDAHDDIDLDLTGLADHTLGAGESVDFLLAFSGGEGDDAGGHHLFIDNAAITGAFPPSSGPSVPPMLEYGMSGSGMVFNWTGSGFMVQSRTNLTEGIWVDVPGGDIPPVNVTATNGTAFYRLIEL